MAAGIKRVTKTNTGADAYSNSVPGNACITALFNDETNADWAGNFVIQKSKDQGTTWVTVFRTAIAAGDPPVYKTIYTAEGDCYWRVGTTNRTAGTACVIEISSAFIPGR